MGVPLAFGSFRQNRNFADEKNIKKVGKGFGVGIGKPYKKA